MYRTKYLYTYEICRYQIIIPAHDNIQYCTTTTQEQQLVVLECSLFSVHVQNAHTKARHGLCMTETTTKSKHYNNSSACCPQLSQDAPHSSNQRMCRGARIWKFRTHSACKHSHPHSPTRPTIISDICLLF